MSADRRWTGGIANREWNRGTAPRADEVMSAERRQVLQAQVKRYLRDCARFRTILDDHNHPTPRGMLKIVFCRDQRDRDTALEEYAILTGQ